jgi:hypothetical protein
MKKTPTFFELLIGTTDVSMWTVGFIFALLAAFVVFRLQVHERDKHSRFTPVHFSWQFILMDNALRILTTVCLIFIGLRLSKEIFGLETSVYTSIAVGTGCDKISAFLKNLGKVARK